MCGRYALWWTIYYGIYSSYFWQLDFIFQNCWQCTMQTTKKVVFHKNIILEPINHISRISQQILCGIPDPMVDGHFWELHMAWNCTSWNFAQNAPSPALVVTQHVKNPPSPFHPLHERCVYKPVIVTLLDVFLGYLQVIYLHRCSLPGMECFISF